MQLYTHIYLDEETIFEETRELTEGEKGFIEDTEEDVRNYATKNVIPLEGHELTVIQYTFDDDKLLELLKAARMST